LRYLSRRGITRKKLSIAAIERNEGLRDRYMLHMRQYAPEQLVFADETGYNRFTSRRPYGWAFEGDRARRRDFFIRGTKISLLPALSLDGIIYFIVKEGSHNAASFATFVDGLLYHMNPFPHPKSVLVIDNAGIHKAPEIKAMVEARGMRLVYLPPYSPDFNPIEEAFSSMKAWIRRNRDHVRAEMADGYQNAHVVLGEAICSVTPAMTWQWFAHSNYIHIPVQ